MADIPAAPPPVPWGSGRPSTCALDGCDEILSRHRGGGRPRLYCSDAHRAEARRRRRRRTGGSGEGVRPLRPEWEGLRTALQELLERVEQLGSETPWDEALVAAIRAEAAEEVLRAQQTAAHAARSAADAQERLARERREWEAAAESLQAESARQARLVTELEGALEGAREELERELLAHHADADRAASLLQAHAAAHAAELTQVRSELTELQRRLRESDTAAARAEERARLADARLELDRLRRERAEDRRHLRAVETELHRRVAREGGAKPRGRARTAPAGAAPAR